MAETCCPQYTIRLNSKDFKLTKGHKKILNKFNRYVQGSWSPDNEQQEKQEKKPPKDNTPKDLFELVNATDKTKNKYRFKIETEPSSFTSEKYRLYKKYQMSVHQDKEEDVSEKGFRRFLVDSPLKPEEKNQVRFGSFHQKYMLDQKLVALSVVDILPKCVSAVYFMYDPDYAFLGLGKYSSLRETAFAQELNKKVPSLQYYYMDSCAKMRYKSQYEPSDLLDPVDYTWYPIEDFKKEFENNKYVSFAKNSKNQRNGWLNPKQVTSPVLSTVRVYIGNGSVIPANKILQLVDEPEIKQFLVQYVCAVGLTLASDMLLSF